MANNPFRISTRVGRLTGDRRVMGLLLLLAIGGFVLFRYLVRASRRWESLLRRTRFASANSLVRSSFL